MKFDENDPLLRHCGGGDCPIWKKLGSAPNSSDKLIFLKKIAIFYLKYEHQKDEQTSSSARLLLRSATPLHVQSIIELSSAAQLRYEHALNH